ncbi:MAG: radical SAM protein [bacterium]
MMRKRVMNIQYFTHTALSILRGDQFILYHKPTTSCNCRCEFCDFWKNQDTEPGVKTQDVIKMLDDGWKAGLTTYSLWGGEPLMVRDLGIWLKHAKKLGYKTSLCTSGYMLEERFDDINGYIDIILLSLEGVYENQDKIRNTPGLFDRIIRGVKKFRERGKAKIKIWSHINRLNNNSILPILKFAHENGLSVEFFPSNIFSDYNEEIIFSPEEKYRVFTAIMKLKKNGMPVNNSMEALKLMRGDSAYRCNMARNAVHVDSNGKITPCEERFVESMQDYGNILNQGLTLIHNKSTRHYNVKNLQNCRRCLFPCIAESAGNIYIRSLRRFADFISGKDI